MDNFHFVDVKPAIDRSQTDFIKEAIFKRAREKAAALSAEKSEDYTDQIQNDVMEFARESLSGSSLNPFNKFLENVGINSVESDEIQAAQETQDKIDLEDVYTREVKKNIESITNGSFVNSVKEETMKAAREQFRINNDFTASLNFLNTQAAIRMAENAHSKIDYLI